MTSRFRFDPEISEKATLNGQTTTDAKVARERRLQAEIHRLRGTLLEVRTKIEEEGQEYSELPYETIYDNQVVCSLLNLIDETLEGADD